MSSASTDGFPRQKIFRVFGWGVVIAIGTGAIATLALFRNEPVSALWMVVAALCVFAVSYRFHSAWLMAKVLTLDEFRATPAVVHEDGKDFCERTNGGGLATNSRRSRGRGHSFGQCLQPNSASCPAFCGWSGGRRPAARGLVWGF